MTRAPWPIVLRGQKLRTAIKARGANAPATGRIDSLAVRNKPAGSGHVHKNRPPICLPILEEVRDGRGVQPVSRQGDWLDVLIGILEKEAMLPRRECRSTQRLFEELRGHGYSCAHDSVHRFVKAWRDERARVPVQAFVPMSLGGS